MPMILFKDIYLGQDLEILKLIKPHERYVVNWEKQSNKIKGSSHLKWKFWFFTW